METKEELDLEDLQQWQKDILIDSYNRDIEKWENTYTIIPKEEISLTKAQRNMLEKVLGGDFFIGDEKVREILEAVFECGFYYKKDREVLNLARESYIKGRNWIKVDS